MEASEEDDYMSDAFLAACEPAPGVPKRKQDKRDFEIYKKKLKTKEVAEEKSEDAVRERALKTAISTDNKGFQMLTKMGFQPGTSLGKNKNGIVEPIAIELRKGHSGLGKKQKIIVKSESTCTLDDGALETFQRNCANIYKKRRIMSYFFKAQKACAKLDKSAGVTSPMARFFWPKAEIEPEDTEDDSSEDEEEEEEDAPFSDENLVKLNEYLRDVRLYCVFCCIEFQNEEEMESLCPGPSYDDHPE